MTEGIFNHITSDKNYWSNSLAGADWLAWTVNFDDGGFYYRTTSSNYPVRCVRNIFIILKSFSRSDDIVTDNVTKLQWQDDSAAASTVDTWEEAIDYCENSLTLGDYDDWRLPNLNELLSIVDITQRYRAIYSDFQNIGASYPESRYWSSTTYAKYADGAWRVMFDGYGYPDPEPKHVNGSIRCVRGGKINIPVNPSIIMYLLN